MPNCKQCTSSFEITDEDRKFLKKTSPIIKGQAFTIPEPTFCPDCRRQRRLAFRNERSLYRRNCDLCEKSFISIFPVDAPFPVYCSDCWWSDKWDPLKYGQDFDFNRSFAEQFKELHMKVPKSGTLIYRCENCEYNSLQGLSRNTYMSPGSYRMEDCLYMRKGQYCKDSMDCLISDHCELVYEALNSKGCYNANYLIQCNNISDSEYMAFCDSCKHCFMCSDLRQKEYYIQNKQYSKEEYESKVSELKKKPYSELMEQFLAFVKTIPKRAVTLVNTENCVGDRLYDCKNVFHGFDCFNCEDCRYVYDTAEGKDMMDVDILDKMNELCYECCTGGDQNVRDLFCFCPVYSQDTMYCYCVWQCQYMFGCNSISKKFLHCILNKQYSKEEYETLVPQIIEHMKKTGEWGEFMPADLSLHTYNESLANDYYPLTRDEAVKQGFKWRDIEEKTPDVTKKIPASQLPDDIESVPDEVLDWAIECEETGRLFRIQPQELKFYRKKSLPIPHLHPDVRHKKRLHLQSPNKLFSRKCDNCQVDIRTTYSPDRPEKVYCEKCYLETIY